MDQESAKAVLQAFVSFATHDDPFTALDWLQDDLADQDIVVRYDVYPTWDGYTDGAPPTFSAEDYRDAVQEGLSLIQQGKPMYWPEGSVKMEPDFTDGIRIKTIVTIWSPDGYWIPMLMALAAAKAIGANTCDMCGNVYFLYRRRTGKKKQRFCSNKCKQKAWRNGL